MCLEVDEPEDMEVEAWLIKRLKPFNWTCFVKASSQKERAGRSLGSLLIQPPPARVQKLRLWQMLMHSTTTTWQLSLQP